MMPHTCSVFTQIRTTLTLCLSSSVRRDVSVDPDDISVGEGPLPRGGGHERLVRLQRHPRTSRVRQPGVPEENGLRGPELPETSVRPTDPAGTRVFVRRNPANTRCRGRK